LETVLGISASGSPFQILMISLPFEADFKHFSLQWRSAAGRMPKHADNRLPDIAATAQLRCVIFNISLERSLILCAWEAWKYACRSKHCLFLVYDEVRKCAFRTEHLGCSCVSLVRGCFLFRALCIFGRSFA
jgi:hypothetical protein